MIQAFGRRGHVSTDEILGLEGGAGLGRMITGGAVSGGTETSDTAMDVPPLVPGTILAGVRGISFGVGVVVVVLVILAMAGAAASLPTVETEPPATVIGGMDVPSALRVAGRLLQVGGCTGWFGGN